MNFPNLETWISQIICQKNRPLTSIVVFKVLRLNGRPYCYSSVSFSLLLLLFFFILLDFSQTPGRIFMKFSGMVYIGLERPKIIFRVMTSLPAWNIDDFLILRVVILWRYLLRNDSRYLFQIFTDDRQRFEVYSTRSTSV